MYRNAHFADHFSGHANDHGIEHLYRDVLNNYWPSQRQLIEEGYHSITLPFEELPPPYFAMKTQWSAVQKYQQAMHTNPITATGRELRHCWGLTTHREVTWPLTLKIWKV